MEEFERQALLFDFYGALLTEKQRQVFSDHFLNDLSLGEIAEDCGISRQAAHDMIRRIKKTLVGYEEKLGLLDRFLKIREQAEEISDIAKESGLERVVELTHQILDEL